MERQTTELWFENKLIKVFTTHPPFFIGVTYTDSFNTYVVSGISFNLDHANTNDTPTTLRMNIELEVYEK